MNLKHFIEQMEVQFFDVIEKGSDEELALSSYLQGHFDLMLTKTDAEKTHVYAFIEHFESSLLTAFEQGELASQDQREAKKLWNNLKSQCLLSAANDNSESISDYITQVWANWFA